MAEKSMFWTTGATGDGANEYTQQETINWMRALFVADITQHGVFTYGGALEVTAGSGARELDIADGAALVAGFFYTNSAAVTKTLTHPTIGTTGWRLVLRADWIAQTVRITLLQSSDGVSAIPTVTQSDGTVWDIPLAHGTITTGDVITIEDDREFVTPNVRVADANLRKSSALSVIGRANNSAGDPADIAATSNDTLLARVSNALQWVKLTLGMIPDALITEAKLAASVASKLVTNGNSHNHAGGDGAQIDHANLANTGTNTHATIDGHISATSAHSATSAATANRIMMRDSAGRVQVAAPSAAADVARKAEVDAVSSALNTHKSSSDHDARYFTESEANARFAPMAHDHVGGDGATLSYEAMANRTRSFLVPAQPGESGAAPGEFGAEPAGWAGVKLPDGIRSQAVGYAAVPEDFVSNMRATPCYVPGATGSAVCTWWAHYCANGEGIGEHTSGQEWIALSGTPATMRIWGEAPLPSAAKGDVIRFVLTRHGDDALDTMGDYLHLIGWLVTYTADM